MIVVGIDPGGRDTGVVLVDDQQQGDASLLDCFTVTREESGHLAEVPHSYLLAVAAAVLHVCSSSDVALVAVEGVNRPRGHAAGRRGHLIDPSGLLATAQVLGAVRGLALTRVPIVVVPPGRNGSHLPPASYPTPIRGTTAGKDNRRHMRSAYDVALQGPPIHRLERLTR